MRLHVSFNFLAFAFYEISAFMQTRVLNILRYIGRVLRAARIFSLANVELFRFTTSDSTKPLLMPGTLILMLLAELHSLQVKSLLQERIYMYILNGANDVANDIFFQARTGTELSMTPNAAPNPTQLNSSQYFKGQRNCDCWFIDPIQWSIVREDM